MAEVFRGVRTGDAVLAGGLTALGAVLMWFNITESGTQDMAHPIDSRSLWMLPLFAVATLPVLWWRRDVLAAAWVSLGALVLHDLAFGWVTRCGVGLPLAFTYAFLGALRSGRTRAWWCLGVSTAITVAVLVRDASAGPSALPLAVPVVLIVFGVGWAARHRASLNRRLQARDEELRRLRDDRAALMVADDRARLSRQLDGLLQERLEELTRAAESADGLAPAQARALLESIESGSRQTMEDMREIVGLLRGGSDGGSGGSHGDEVSLTPAPTVAHLDALLARHRSPLSRLTVGGDPRALPATVELSAYRIVEYLVTALAEHPVQVAVHFDDEILEIRVQAAVGRGSPVRAAVARVRERAALHAGSVDVKVARGSARVVAQLPVLG